MKNKIIFLDIDGVITSPRVLSWYNWDIYAVNFLRWICEKADCKIVISSTWRNNHKQDFFETIFNNLHEDWKTPNMRRYSEVRHERGYEIKKWLENHPEIEDYLIIDDDSDMLDEQISHFIQTDSINGILFDNMMKIRDYFKIEDFPKEVKKLYIHDNMFAEYKFNTIKKDYGSTAEN